jgi:hypothetical protein
MINKMVYGYFRNPANLIVKVNEMSSYFRLERLVDIKMDVTNNLVPVEIDESELDNGLLKNESIFSLMALYAMGTGQ